MSDVSRFLERSDYEKHEAFSFSEIGATIQGVICEPPRIVEVPDINNAGQRVEKMVLALETTDGETFAVWIQEGAMAATISKAVKTAGAKTIDQGGTLAIKHTGNAEPKRKGYKGAFQYAAKYTPPEPTTGVDVDDIFGDNADEKDPF